MESTELDWYLLALAHEALAGQHWKAATFCVMHGLTYFDQSPRSSIHFGAGYGVDQIQTWRLTNATVIGLDDEIQWLKLREMVWAMPKNELANLFASSSLTKGYSNLEREIAVRRIMKLRQGGLPDREKILEGVHVLGCGQIVSEIKPVDYAVASLVVPLILGEATEYPTLLEEFANYVKPGGFLSIGMFSSSVRIADKFLDQQRWEAGEFPTEYMVAARAKLIHLLTGKPVDTETVYKSTLNQKYNPKIIPEEIARDGSNSWEFMGMQEKKIRLACPVRTFARAALSYMIHDEDMATRCALIETALQHADSVVSLEATRQRKLSYVYSFVYRRK